MRAWFSPLLGGVLVSLAAHAESSGWVVCAGSSDSPDLIEREIESSVFVAGEPDFKFNINARAPNGRRGWADIRCVVRRSDGRTENYSQRLDFTSSSTWRGSGLFATGVSIDCGCSWQGAPSIPSTMEFSGPPKPKAEPPKTTQEKYQDAMQRLEEIQRQRREADARKAAETAERAREEETRRRAADGERRLKDAERKAEEARQKAEAAQRRYDAAMSQATDFDARSQEAIRTGQGDAMGYSLQASLSRMQANAALNGQDEAARQIAMQQARLLQQQSMVNAGVGLATGLLSMWIENDYKREQAEIARIEREEIAREARERAAEEQRQRDAERARLEADRVAAQEELRRAQEAAAEQARIARNEALAAQMGASAPTSAPALKPVNGPAVTLKPLSPSGSVGPVPVLRPLPEANPREDGRRYLRVFVDGDCPVRVSGVTGFSVKVGTFTPLPATSARALTLASDCFGVAQLYEGRATAARGTGVFGRNQPLTIPLSPSR